MANDKANPQSTQNRGQQKLHDVRNAQTGETRQITQEQWRNRSSDPSLAGFERVDGDTGDGSSEPGATSGGAGA